jgi:hypothetical protein
MCEDFTPNFGNKRTGCYITATHHLTFLFHQIIFYQKQHECYPPPILIFSVSRLKIKLKCRYFNTIEVNEAESQAVLNIVTEHDFQVAVLGTGTTSTVMVANRREVSFWPDGSTSPGNYG